MKKNRNQWNYWFLS